MNEQERAEGECKHENWQVLGSNLVGCGHCNDCGKEIQLDVLFNGLKGRVEILITRLENKLEGK